MTQRQRLRRTAFLCIHTLNGIACYRAGIKDNRAHYRTEFFWMLANSNFVEMAILQWCKVFGDKKAKHYAWKVASKPEKLTKELLDHLKLKKFEFDDYVKIMRNLRDKFIAHLDDDTAAPLPKLDVAIDSAKFLIRYLFQNENKENYLEGVPRFPDPIYRTTYHAAKLEYTGEPEVHYTGGRKPTGGT